MGVDAVRPDYYNRASIECIEAIKASMSRDEFMGFLKGNVIKYVWRYKEKNGLEDLRKANYYLEQLEKERTIEEIKAEMERQRQRQRQERSKRETR